MSLEIYQCENCKNVFVEPDSGIPRCPQCRYIAVTFHKWELEE